MNVLYAGQFQVKEWIEPLISTLLVGEEHGSSDVSNTMTTMTSSSLVQVVSIGRPTWKQIITANPNTIRRSTMPMSNMMPIVKPAKQPDLAGYGLMRSTSFSNVPQLLKATDDESTTIPTSLLISDGTTTILAVLSSQTRSNLARLATDNSLNSYQNNTITRGCVLKITDWGIETLASALRTEEENSTDGSKTGDTRSVDDGDDSSDLATLETQTRVEIVETNSNEGAPKDTCGITLSSSDYGKDPLLRDHQTLLHHPYYDRNSRDKLSLEKVVVLYVRGPIEIMGGHGLSVVGRPTYIMETIDVLRSIDAFTGSQVQSKIMETHRSSNSSLAIKRRIHSRTGSATPSLDTTYGADPNVNNINATIVTPAFLRRTVTTALEKPQNVARGITGDSVPLGDVEHLFHSPKRTKLNAIWEAFASASATPSAPAISGNDHTKNSTGGIRQELFDMGGTISNDSNDDSSSSADFPIGIINASADPMELKRLFGRIIDTGKEKDVSVSANVDDTECIDRFATQLVEEVMSDEYSDSDVSCDEDDNDSHLGIDNMLVEENTESSIEIAIAVPIDCQADDMQAQKPTARQQKHLRIKPAVMKPNPQAEDLYSDDDKGSDILEVDIQQVDEDLLETQPIHPVYLADQGNVIDDDVSVDDDVENMLPDETQCDPVTRGNEMGNRGHNEVEEFHGVVSKEEDLPVDGSYTPVESLNDIVARCDGNGVDLTLDEEVPLGTQTGALPLGHMDVMPIDRTDRLSSKSYEQSDDSIELTFHRWIRATLDDVNGDCESTTGTSSGTENQFSGDSLRNFLCKP